MEIDNLDRPKLLKLAQAITILTENRKYNLIDSVFPDTGPFSRDAYSKHVEFMQAGKTHRYRVLSGGNGSGKSFTTGTELTYHLTGEYPHWWEGHRFKKAIKAWVIAESGSLWRDSLQSALLGPIGDEIGIGLLRKDLISDTKSLPGVPGAIGQIYVKHKSGSISSVVVKTFEMGREQFQAATLDLIVFDEEPPETIYSECITRLRGVKGKKDPGICLMGFTPLKGLSDVVLRYLPGGQFPEGGVHPEFPDRYAIAIDWDHAPHLTEADKKAMLNEYHPNERDARSKGIPMLGSGRIYPLIEDDVVVQPFKVPDYFPRAFGLDFGWNCTAALWGAQDPTTNIIYLYAEYKQGKVADYQHIYSIKERGDWISGAADPSGGGRRDDGRMRIDYYRSLGLNLHPGYNSLISGISQVFTLFDSGSIKIFSNLEKFLSEFRVYRYDSKDLNKPARNQEDHLLDCLRYLISLFDTISLSKYDSETPEEDSFEQYNRWQQIDPLTGY